MAKSITIDGVEYIPASEAAQAAQPNKDGLEYCIIRTYSAGVWAGYIDTKSKDACQEVYDARRLWRWWSDFTLSALALRGAKKGKEGENKYAVAVPRVILKEIIEVIPCSDKAAAFIQSHPEYHED